MLDKMEQARARTVTPVIAPDPEPVEMPAVSEYLEYADGYITLERKNGGPSWEWFASFDVHSPVLSGIENAYADAIKKAKAVIDALSGVTISQ